MKFYNSIGPNPHVVWMFAAERGITLGFRFGEGLALFKDRITTAPAASEGLKRIAAEKIAWLDGLMDGREFVCANRISLADVLLYCFLAFGKTVGQPFAESNTNIQAWFERMAGRESAAA